RERFKQLMRGYNDDELTDIIDFGRDRGAEVRFIEYMDVGGATRWSMDLVVSSREILSRLERHYGPIEPLHNDGSAPAHRYGLPDGTTFGIIASTTEPFCRACDRSRLTGDGMWFLCLYAAHGIDLRKPLRQRASQDEIRSLIVRGWTDRTDRGAEDRQALSSRGPLYQIKDLRKDPHREMHTLGG
ncbi:MAG: cyclic pyranopterin phosphate synthase MoaA, partial [Gemmatimonadetes bacterium]|nr:cyclic pyranopterin phosphate synthase MoaA [Gemmatimonadota bacterium]